MNSAAGLSKPAEAGFKASFPPAFSAGTRFSAFSVTQAANSFAAEGGSHR
jgi:hypothetical protein